jgi:hypothetical protein
MNSLDHIRFAAVLPAEFHVAGHAPGARGEAPESAAR